MNRLYCAVAVLLVAVSAQAQMPHNSEAVKAEMAKLGVIAGKWEGTSLFMTPSGDTTSSNVTEDIYFKLDSTLLILEGIGKNDSGEIVHNAFGLIFYDSSDTLFMMKSFRNGSSTDANFEILIPNKSFRWSYIEPRGGTMRYTLEFEDGHWMEIGEYSRDGEKWFQFFEMSLQRIAD